MCLLVSMPVAPSIVPDMTEMAPLSASCFQKSDDPHVLQNPRFASGVDWNHASVASLVILSWSGPTCVADT